MFIIQMHLIDHGKMPNIKLS